jgi:tRNA(fMet)-specific endonuclease VapC
MPYLLDTNVMSDLVRHPLGRVWRRIEDVGVDQVCTSILVSAELRYGVEKRGSPDLAEKIQSVLDTFNVVPFMPPADLMYARVRHMLTARGQLIGSNDLFIAAHALALGCTMVTANLREFSRVEGLICENWLT